MGYVSLWNDVRPIVEAARAFTTDDPLWDRDTRGDPGPALTLALKRYADLYPEHAIEAGPPLPATAAEGLDVERLARALGAAGACRDIPWCQDGHIGEAADVAAEYARLVASEPPAREDEPRDG